MEGDFRKDLFGKEMLMGSGDLPIYHRIRSTLLHYIRSGQLKPGEMLPSEWTLCEVYSVSRTTIRLALDELAEENLIVRRRGRGSYVSNPKLPRDLNHLYSFTEDMKSMNKNPHSRVMECTVAKASQDMAARLSIPEDGDVFKLVRVRCADGEPLLYETTYVPYYLCPGIEKEDFTYGSLYRLLQYQYHLKPDRALETYEAVKLNKDTAGFLNCPASGPAFLIRRTGYLENEIPFEYTYSTVRSDKCIFTVELKAGKSQVHFTRQIGT